MARVLIIDDDESACRMLCELVSSINHEADYALTLAAGRKAVQLQDYDVIFLDVRMPDGNGLSELSAFRETSSLPEVIIITGLGDVDGAELAIKNGAWDYIQKPISPKKIILPLRRVLQYRDDLKKTAGTPLVLNRAGIIGESRKIRTCLEAVAQAAVTEANILIFGETGTGKELFSRAVHENSQRSEKQFVVIDCAAMTESLMKSTLFGFEKGAFTGAEHPTEGLIKQADLGTLFLDEIGELSLAAQKVFLRVLQERSFRPIGGKEEVKSNFRLISATNRDLNQMVREGLFRQDLLFRLRTITIEVPPLRERQEDIDTLARHFCSNVSARYGLSSKVISESFYQALHSYPWPGNVRELNNAMEHACLAARMDTVLYTHHLPQTIRIQVVQSALDREGPTAEILPIEAATEAQLSSFKEYRQQSIFQAEHDYLLNLMQAAKGSMKKACEISGLGRTRLYTLLRQHHISKTGWPD